MHTATPLYKDSRTIKGFVVKLPGLVEATS
jgi:hypothetical protein